MTEPADPPTAHATSTLVSLRDRRWSVVAAIVAIVVAGVAVVPLVEPLVDWGMDGRLSPGDWEPNLWLKGAAIAGLCLSAAGSPLLLILGVALAVGCRGRERPRWRSHSARTDDVAAPRRPGRADVRVIARTFVVVIGSFLALTASVTAVSSGIAWVRLENEEDAFGERARAAAAAGQTSYSEASRNGSYLWWSAERGYGSHRD